MQRGEQQSVRKYKDKYEEEILRKTVKVFNKSTPVGERRSEIRVL